MATTKNLCAQISLDLHQKISEGKEAAGLTTAQYITELLTEYFKMKENGGKTEASVECDRAEEQVARIVVAGVVGRRAPDIALRADVRQGSRRVVAVARSRA